MFSNAVVLRTITLEFLKSHDDLNRQFGVENKQDLQTIKRRNSSMIKTKRFQMVTVFAILLSVLVMLSGCFPGFPKKSPETDSNSDKNSVMENAKQDNDNTATATATPQKEELNPSPVYNFYNKVTLGQAKADVEAVLGVAPETDANGESVFYDPGNGYGVSVVYGADNLVTTKTLLLASGAVDFLALNNAAVNESQVASIKEGMTYNEVKAILGVEGMEFIRMKNPIDINKPLLGMAWVNSDGSSIVVNFTGYKGIVNAAEYTSASQ